MVDTRTRALECACRACYLLFTQPGAGHGQHRAVPDRYRYTPAFAGGARLWDSVAIPVRTAFFLTNSISHRTTAFYPGPAGATESLLSIEAWAEVLRDSPVGAVPAEDTEALLVRKLTERFECFLIPVDVCYRLVGLVRTYWKGFDGGSQTWQAIEDFFAGLRDRSEWVDGA